MANKTRLECQENVREFYFGGLVGTLSLVHVCVFLFVTGINEVLG